MRMRGIMGRILSLTGIQLGETMMVRSAGLWQAFGLQAWRYARGDTVSDWEVVAPSGLRRSRGLEL